MLLKKKDFWSALMKESLPVRQYAETVQAAGDSALFLPSFLEYIITGKMNGFRMEYSVPHPSSVVGQMSLESGEVSAAYIVGGIK